MITVVAKHSIKRSALDLFKSLGSELVAKTRQEPGCLEYGLHRLADKQRVFSFIEKWENQECLKRHVNSDHFKRIVPKLKKCCRKTGTVDIYEEMKTTPETDVVMLKIKPAIKKRVSKKSVVKAHGKKSMAKKQDAVSNPVAERAYPHSSTTNRQN